MSKNHYGGTVEIFPQTTKEPITLIGQMAGICWGADTEDSIKNYRRGIDCILNNHGRTLEFPEVYMTLDEWSARVIREYYTHIGGSPTRLQASTRYIKYEDFSYVIPPSIASHGLEAERLYKDTMQAITEACTKLEDMGVPREDAAMLLPLGMDTKVVTKINLRTLMDMSRQRMCSRAYHEFRLLFSAICKALKEYSSEWKTAVDLLFMPKCEALGYCPEKNSCGRKLQKKDSSWMFQYLYKWDGELPFDRMPIWILRTEPVGKDLSKPEYQVWTSRKLTEEDKKEYHSIGSLVGIKYTNKSSG